MACVRLDFVNGQSDLVTALSSRVGQNLIDQLQGEEGGLPQILFFPSFNKIQTL